MGVLFYAGNKNKCSKKAPEIGKSSNHHEIYKKGNVQMGKKK